MTINITKYGVGKPLVLFHGWGFDGQVFTPIVHLLTKYQLYIVDLPGFGLTKDMSWDEFKSNLLKQLPDKFSVLGWSLGGLVATRLCIEAQSRVENLVNVASSPKFIKELDWVGIDKDIFNKFYINLKRDPIKTRSEFINIQLGIKDELSKDSSTPDITPTLVGLQLGLEWLLEWDFRDGIKEISIPTLYMFGRLDTIIPRRLMLKMQATFPQFKYTMFNKAAHAPFLSHRHEFILALSEFIL
jgi:pimeloyl-[acyl-carrier protein] methyl ester esterase